MKINGNFQDYYDSALGSFLESDVVFNRTSSVTTLPVTEPTYATLGENFDSHLRSVDSYLKKHPYFIKEKIISENATWRPNLYVLWLGFCGKYYPMVTPSGTIGEIVWNRYDRNIDLKKWLGFFFKPSSSLNVEHTDFETVKRYANICFTFKNREEDEYKYPGLAEFWKDEAFERFGPIFIMIYPVYCKYTKGSPNIFVIRNPCLKTVGFQKVMDPFTTLYTLNEWLDSHARPDDAVVPVGDDLTRIKAYGFDPKTSFRKSKEKT